MKLALSVKGLWTNWDAFFHNRSMPSTLMGSCRMQMHPVSISAFMNRNWVLDSEFSIHNFHSLSLNTCSAQSNLIQIKAQGEIDEDFPKSSAHLSFTIPNLARSEE